MAAKQPVGDKELMAFLTDLTNTFNQATPGLDADNAAKMISKVNDEIQDINKNLGYDEDITAAINEESIRANEGPLCNSLGKALTAGTEFSQQLTGISTTNLGPVERAQIIESLRKFQTGSRAFLKGIVGYESDDEVPVNPDAGKMRGSTLTGCGNKAKDLAKFFTSSTEEAKKSLANDGVVGV